MKRLLIGINFVLRSKKTFYVLTCAWIANVIYSFLFIPQSADDTFYFFSSLGFFHKYNIGMLEGDLFSITFFQFPGYSLFNGIFLYLSSVITIPLNYYTYRLFHRLLILLIMILGYYFIKAINQNNRNVLHVNLYILILLLSPFSLNTMITVRPEALGIVFVLCGLLSYMHWKNNKVMKKKCSLLVISGLFFGLSVTTHPIFVLLSGIVCFMIIVLEVRKRSFVNALIFGAIALVPPLIMLFWIWAHAPESIDQITLKADHLSATPFALLLRNIKQLVSQSFLINEWPLFIKIYYAIFSLPLFLFIILSILLIVLNVKKVVRVNDEIKILMSLFFGGLIIFFIFPMHDYHFAVTAFTVALFFPLFYTLFYDYNIDENSLTPRSLIVRIIYYLTIMTSFLFILIHTAKFTLSETKYYYMPNTRHSLSPYLKPTNTLILTAPSLFGPFVDLFSQQFTPNPKISTYYLFPFSIEGPTKSKEKEALLFLQNKIPKLLPGKTIWGSQKKRISFNKETMVLKLTLNGGYKINIRVKKIIFEDKSFVFYTHEHLTLLN